MLVREFNPHSDYAMLVDWWTRRDFPPVHLHSLPPTGIVVERDGLPVCAGFLYKPENIAWAEWIVSNPDADSDTRHYGLDLLMSMLHSVAKNFGYRVVFTSSNNAEWMERLKKHGYLVGDTSVTQLFKPL